MDQTIKVYGERESKARNELIEIEKEAKRIIKEKWNISFSLYDEIFFVAFTNKNELGCFVPSDRIILLSETLIDEGFETIKNVFLHELSHALNLAINNSGNHDASFREYCHILGVEDGFYKARVSLNREQREKKKEKFEKLMAMSSSPYENEAMIALKKARELMLENDGLKKKEKEEKVYQATLYSSHRIPSYYSNLGQFAGFVTGSYVLKVLDGSSSSISAIGTVEQVEATIYLFNSLLSSLDKEVSKLRKKGYKITKDNFVRGAIPEMKNKLRFSDSSTEKAIEAVTVENRRLAKKLIYSNMYFRNKKSYYSYDSLSFNFGKEFGKNVDISSTIGRKELK